MTKAEEQIRQIINRRLFGAPPNVKKTFPKSILEGSGFYVSFSNDKLHVLMFLSQSEKEGLDDRIRKKYDPFPGLLTMEEGVGAAFRFENSKNCIIESCGVNNSYLLSLGENSSIVLIDHNQSVNTAELGIVSYKIDLGFIITFPSKETPFDLGGAIDDLISFYVGNRREKA